MKKTNKRYVATREVQYTDGQHVKKVFKPGEELGEYEPGHLNFDKFLPEELLTSRDKKLLAKAKKDIEAIMRATARTVTLRERK